jgi:hypothetical protein
MSPGKSTQKPLTPESVRVLMIIELGINAFFAYWIYSEYLNNVYFKIYVDSMIVAHLTTYTAALGLGIGLAGSAIAATLYHNLKHAKNRLETLANTKLKPSVQKILPTLEQYAPPLATVPSVQATNAPNTEPAPVQGTMPVLLTKEEEKPSN